MAVTELTPMMAPSVDSQRANANRVLRQLIDAKFVEETRQVESYPNLSGTWINDQREYYRSRFELRQAADSNEIRGTCTYGFENAEWESTVTGSVDTNGKVQLVPDKFVEKTIETFNMRPGSSGSCLGRSGEIDYQHTVDGNVAILQQTSWGDTRFSGKPRQESTVTMYAYSFSPNIQLIQDGRDTWVKAGTYEIDQVSGLLLMAETRATAEFSWHAVPDRLGTILLSEGAAPSGKGSAHFGKKPDGTWVLTGLRM